VSEAELRKELERANDVIAEFRKRDAAADRIIDRLTSERDQARAERDTAVAAAAFQRTRL
jgi:peptidoglycan hydrolase CwlO-like protein